MKHNDNDCKACNEVRELVEILNELQSGKKYSPQNVYRAMIVALCFMSENVGKLRLLDEVSFVFDEVTDKHFPAHELCN
jgi:hypothetical protein